MISMTTKSSHQIKRRLAEVDFRWPEESDDFSWDDAFDVMQFWTDLVQKMYPEDLPPFLVKALQFGPEAVSAEEADRFAQRQAVMAAPRD